MVERGTEGQQKIAFVGTSCIGKTTVIEHYQQRFVGDPQFAFVGEAAREYFTQHPDVEDRFSVDTQGQVQALALHNEQTAHAIDARVIICDRSVLDAPSYIRANGDEEGAKELLDRVAFWLPTYDKFLLLDPADIPYETDEVRQESEEDRERFHQGFIDFFSEYNIPYELVSGTVEERIARVDEILAIDSQ